MPQSYVGFGASSIASMRLSRESMAASGVVAPVKAPVSTWLIWFWNSVPAPANHTAGSNTGLSPAPAYSVWGVSAAYSGVSRMGA